MADPNLERKIDDLQTTVNRLSQNFENYVHNAPLDKKGKKNAGADAIDEFTTDFSQDENEDRGNWTGRLDFLLACLGYAVGLGNVWRFPYLCYKNGGAVFFIPYVIMLFFVGMPIFFLELSLGQFTSSGPITCWEMAPIFKGVGVGMVIVSSLVAIYYNMIIAWAIYYFFASFTSNLPWENCDRDWASDFCRDYLNDSAVNCSDLGYYERDNGVCYTSDPEEVANATVFGIWNSSMAEEHDIKSTLPSEDYLNREVLHKHEADIGDMGGARWQLVLCYLLAWIIVALSLIKGVKSSGKVVYFTALFPYLVLVILLVRGLTLDNYYEGIEFYILKPDLDKLSDAQVWKDAAVQIFFSLSASWGGLIALSSYNRFHNDCLRDSLIVSLGNCLTSFFAGFVIFSFLGFLAGVQGTSVEDVADSGVGLAFIVYPAAVIEMPVSTLWALLFFLMLITLGLDSEFALVETVSTAILDQWPKTRKYKHWVIIILSCVGFLLGLSLCTPGGGYMLTLMDNYAGGWNVLLIALLECICIAYVYGFCRFKEDIRIMIGDTPCCCFPWNFCYPWWGTCWYFFTPIGVLFILLFSWVDYERLTWDDYEYPTWGDALGWLMTLAVVAGVVVTAIGVIIWKLKNGEGFMSVFRPSKYWGPAMPKHRRLMGRYLHDHQYEVDPWEDERGVELDNAKAESGTYNQGFEQKF